MIRGIHYFSTELKTKMDEFIIKYEVAKICFRMVFHTLKTVAQQKYKNKISTHSLAGLIKFVRSRQTYCSPKATFFLLLFII